MITNSHTYIQTWNAHSNGIAFMRTIINLDAAHLSFWIKSVCVPLLHLLPLLLLSTNWIFVVVLHLDWERFRLIYSIESDSNDHNPILISDKYLLYLGIYFICWFLFYVCLSAVYKWTCAHSNTRLEDSYSRYFNLHLIYTEYSTTSSVFIEHFSTFTQIFHSISHSNCLHI